MAHQRIYVDVTADEFSPLIHRVNTPELLRLGSPKLLVFRIQGAPLILNDMPRGEEPTVGINKEPGTNDVVNDRAPAVVVKRSDDGEDPALCGILGNRARP